MLQVKQGGGIIDLLTLALPSSLGALQKNVGPHVAKAISKIGGSIGKILPLIDVFGVARVIVSASFCIHWIKEGNTSLNKITQEETRIKEELQEDKPEMVKDLLKARQGVLASKKSHGQAVMAQNMVWATSLIIASTVLTSVLLRQCGVKFPPQLEGMLKGLDWAEKIVGVGSLALAVGVPLWFGRHRYMKLAKGGGIRVRKLYHQAQQQLIAKKVSALQGRIEFLQNIKGENKKLKIKGGKEVKTIDDRIKSYRNDVLKMNQKIAAIKQEIIKDDEALKSVGEKWDWKALSSKSKVKVSDLKELKNQWKEFLGTDVSKLSKKEKVEHKKVIQEMTYLIEREQGSKVKKLTVDSVMKYLEHTPINLKKIESIKV